MKKRLEIPEAVMRVIDLHRRAKETSEILPWCILHRGYGYYYVCYRPSQSTLVVRDDGRVLSYKDVREVITHVVHLVDVSQNLFFGVGRKRLKPQLVWKLYQMIQCLHHLAERGMGKAFLEKVRLVEEVNLSLIRLEEEIIEVLLSGRRLLLQSVQEQRASAEMITELSWLRERYRQLVQTQQDKLTEDWKEFCRDCQRYFRFVPFFRIDLWFFLWRYSLCYRGVLRALNLHHKDWNLSHVPQDTVPQVEREPLLLTSIYVKNRNPRNSVSG